MQKQIKLLTLSLVIGATALLGACGSDDDNRHNPGVHNVPGCSGCPNSNYPWTGNPTQYPPGYYHPGTNASIPQYGWNPQQFFQTILIQSQYIQYNGSIYQASYAYNAIWSHYQQVATSNYVYLSTYWPTAYSWLYQQQFGGFSQCSLSQSQYAELDFISFVLAYYGNSIYVVDYTGNIQPISVAAYPYFQWYFSYMQNCSYSYNYWLNSSNYYNTGFYDSGFSFYFQLGF